MNYKYKAYFPFKKIRKEQAQAIEFALDSFLKSKKRFCILEMGTGSGKSGVAVTIARYLNKHLKESKTFENGAWFLTTQKMLQDQYIKDFGRPKGDMCTVKSASNYRCNFFSRLNCGESMQLLKDAEKGSRFYKACSKDCTYKTARNMFHSSLMSITNFPYFLTVTAYQGSMKPRRVLCIDEAHTIEDELSKFVEISISERFASAMLDIKMPEGIDNQQKAVDWIRKDYTPKIRNLITEVENEIAELKDKNLENSEEAKRLSNKKDKIEKHYSKLAKFLDLYTIENWVFNLVPGYDKKGRKLEFKAVDISQYTQEYLFRFGEKILLLSATILNKGAYCDSIGINKSDCEFISIDSPFDKDNTPVFYFPVGSMSKSQIDETLPIMANVIETLLEEHKDEKGIIHTRTFKIAEYLKNKIKNDRLLFHESSNKDEILEKHMKSSKPTVILSPSSTEGLDLKGDLSRFQIVCKMHWPFLGDELVKSRMKKSSSWYPYQAVKSLIQARGRSIRTEADHAVTYILDDDFERLYTKNFQLFPKYFHDSLHMD